MPRRELVLTMGGVLLGLFLAALDQTVVATATPRIVTDLGGFDRITWVATAYVVASTTSVPIVGRLTDLYGRKPFYAAGIVVFIFGSVLAGFSQSMDQLIVFRAIQGLGGGVLLAISFVIVGDLFPPAERGKIQGALAAVFGISSVIGPSMGGAITDYLSWHWIFFVNIPLGLPVLYLFMRYFPSSPPAPGSHKLDVVGMVGLVLSIAPLMIGLSLGAQRGWADATAIGLLALAGVSLVGFVVAESRAQDPIMPFDIYRNRVVSLSLVVAFGSGFGMFGVIIFVPLFFQGVLGASATASGTFLTPMMLGVAGGAAVAGQTLSRFGGRYRVQGVLGLGVMVLGMVAVSLMTPDTSFAVAVASIVFMGVGLGVTFPTFTIAVQNAVPFGLLGAATSALQFYRSVGGALGLAVMGAYMSARFASGLDEKLPQSVKDVVPAARLDAIADNPQALVNADALAGLRESFQGLDVDGALVADTVVTALREALAEAIGDVFVVAVVAVSVALVAALFIKDMPLRGRSPQPAEATPAGD